MDRHLSPRIAYWTSAFEPDIEAVAAEVAILRQRFPGSVAWGLSHRHWGLLSRHRGFCLNPRLHLLFRATTWALAPAFHIHHIFGSLGDWFYLRGARRAPTVLTMATFGQAAEPTLLERVDRWVVEYPGGREYLAGLGIDPKEIRLIFPPVDLDRFAPNGEPGGPFTVLFASSPDRADWLEGRGIPALLDAARLRPAVRFRLVWRPWGDSLSRVRELIAERGLSNVELLVGRFSDMPDHYRAAHVTVAPFVDLHVCKPSPNSLVESLASGRPVVATSAVGLAEMIREAGAGTACEPSGPGLAEALDRLRSEWSGHARRARQLAERSFGIEHFVGAYTRLYDELAGSRTMAR